MTLITTDIDHPPHHSGLLMDLIVTLLAPIFLSVSSGDMRMARTAAIGTVNDYRARNASDLIAIAQIIACGFAALFALGLAMDDDVTAPVALQLYRTANALNRSADLNRRAIRQNQAPEPPPDSRPAEPEIPTEVTPDTQVFLSAAAVAALDDEAAIRLQTPIECPPGVSEKRHREMWAIAMANDASEITASIPNLPPAERKNATLRAAALGAAANELLTGARSMPVTPARRASSAPNDRI